MPVVERFDENTSGAGRFFIRKRSGSVEVLADFDDFDPVSAGVVLLDLGSTDRDKNGRFRFDPEGSRRQPDTLRVVSG